LPLDAHSYLGVFPVPIFCISIRIVLFHFEIVSEEGHQETREFGKL